MVNMLATAAVTGHGCAASLRARGIGSNVEPTFIRAQVKSALAALRVPVGTTNDPSRPGPLEEAAV